MRVGEGFGLLGFDALEVPAEGDELLEERKFEGAGGADLGAVALFVLGVGLFFVVANAQAAR